MMLKTYSAGSKLGDKSEEDEEGEPRDWLSQQLQQPQERIGRIPEVTLGSQEGFQSIQNC